MEIPNDTRKERFEFLREKLERKREGNLPTIKEEFFEMLKIDNELTKEGNWYRQYPQSEYIDDYNDNV